MRITRLFVLLALAALLAPRVEASRTSVSESNRPSSLAAMRADAAGLRASLAPATTSDAEPTELPHFDLGDVVLVESELESEERFRLGPLELLSPAPLRGPPPSYPETRVRGFELLPPFRVGASPALSLWGRQACGFSCREVASDSRYDPWGLSFWSSIQGYVAGVVEEADPTGLLPEVESIDAGYGSGTRDGEDFDASKTAGKWTLRGLTALKAGAQKAGKFGVQAVKNALKSQAKEAATTFVAGVAGDTTEQVLLSAGVDEDAARMAGKAVQYGAPSLPSPRRHVPLVQNADAPKRAAGVRSGEGRASVTYEGVKGGKPYSGYASAPEGQFATPEELVAYRYGGSFDDFGGIPPAPVPGTFGTGAAGKAKARGVEQLKYQENVAKYGKEGVANRQNPVGPGNPRRDEYMAAAGAKYERK